MSWTVTDDNGLINVRAILASREEFKQLVEALTRRFPEPPAEPIDPKKEQPNG